MTVSPFPVSGHPSGRAAGLQSTLCCNLQKQFADSAGKAITLACSGRPAIDMQSSFSASKGGGQAERTPTAVCQADTAGP